MKSKCVFMLLIFLSIGTRDYAQSQQRKRGTYRVWIEKMNDEQKVLGTLMKLGDSSITVRYWKEDRVEEVPVVQIEKLKFRRKGGVGKGAAIGGGIGVVTGLISGYAQGDDTPNPDAWIDFSSTAEEKAAGGAFFFGTLGAIAGSVVGSLKKKFLILGQQSKYEALRPELIEYLAY
jgi:hypothetical protein